MKDLIVPDINYQEEIKKCKTMEDVVGKNELMQKLFKEVMQQLLEAEMEDHLEREKYETVCNELDKEIIGLYACGMSVRDIQSKMEELYGIDVSPSMISKITDKVVGAVAE